MLLMVVMCMLKILAMVKLMLFSATLTESAAVMVAVEPECGTFPMELK